MEQSTKMYKFEDTICFDFIEKDDAYYTQENVRAFFQNMGKYGVYFRLTSIKTPAGISFEVIGALPDLIRWNSECWGGDEQSLLDSAKIMQ